jgi:hypothetical protein
VSAAVAESNKSVTAVMKLDDGTHIIVNMPITEDELNAYRESPETFFGAYEPQTKAEHPAQLYESILSVYQNTPRERLLEFMTGHPSIEYFRHLPQSDLAKIYAEGIATNILLAAKSGLPKNATPRSDHAF